ncbi:hypothetical protein FPOAC2_07750 [Fusarium poae]|jgi:hypothetical protein|uniref:Uncharacterized protein n=2 Tax=Fusarium poae TaxID=36050 RepID=A0A1B8AJQ7_FUSPO|nr:hypothetical protein FPOA_07050 [Fusarium poae]
MATLHSRVVSIQPDPVGIDGSDSANHAGYDPKERQMIQGLSQRLQVLRGMSHNLGDGIKDTTAAYEQLPDEALTRPPSQTDCETRWKAAQTTLRILTSSAANIRTILIGLGVPHSAEFESAMNEVPRQVTDSQTDQLVAGHQEEFVNLQNEVKTLRGDLKKAETTIDTL